MGFLFVLFALLTLAGAVAAVTMRQLIHAALCLALSFFGLALMYLRLEAQFVGLAQVLVYVGAVAILLVFAILLARGAEVAREERWSGPPWLGVGMAAVVFAALTWAVLASDLGEGWPDPALSVAEEAAVLHIGVALMTEYVVPLQVMAVLLTAALIGAVLIAMQERSNGPATGGGRTEPASEGNRAGSNPAVEGRREA